MRLDLTLALIVVSVLPITFFWMRVLQIWLRAGLRELVVDAGLRNIADLN